MRFLLTPLLLLAVGYLVICAVLWLRQDSLIFFPSRGTVEELDELAQAEGFMPWTNVAGERIGWQSVSGDPRNALLICHGNGGFALHRNYFAYRAQDSPISFKTYLLEYPGYGARPGAPSEKTITDTAIEAIDTLAADPGRKIWLLGQSLGSGAAAAAVARRTDKISGVILVTPFNSLFAAAHYHYPWLPVPLLIRHRFDSEKNLSKYPGPIAFIVAESDLTIPAKLGQKLYDSYPGKKRLWHVSNAHHNETDRLLADWPEIVTWLLNPT